MCNGAHTPRVCEIRSLRVGFPIELFLFQIHFTVYIYLASSHIIMSFLVITCTVLIILFWLDNLVFTMHVSLDVVPENDIILMKMYYSIQ